MRNHVRLRSWSRFVPYMISRNTIRFGATRWGEVRVARRRLRSNSRRKDTFALSNAQARETFDLHIRPAVSKRDYKQERCGKETLRTKREAQIYGYVCRQALAPFFLFFFFNSLHLTSHAFNESTVLMSTKVRRSGKETRRERNIFCEHSPNLILIGITEELIREKS